MNQMAWELTSIATHPDYFCEIWNINKSKMKLRLGTKRSISWAVVRTSSWKVGRMRAVIICVCLCTVCDDLPLPNKFFLRIQYMAASQKEHWRDHQAPFRWNKSKCKYWVLIMSCLPNNLHAFASRNDSHVVVTLDPNKFAGKKKQRLHIGNLKSFGFLIVLHNQLSPLSILLDWWF